MRHNDLSRMPTYKSPIVDASGDNFRITVQTGSEYRSRETRLRAHYDAASNNGRNEKHWRMADGLSAAAANSAPVRKSIREKARYEYANNGFAKGLAWTLATDLVGTRVRIQFQSGEPELDRLMERRLGRWMRRVKAAKKLRIGRVARSVDGEAFFMRQYSPRMKGRVKTNIRLVECDHFDDPLRMDSDNHVSGVTLDPRDGEPISYTMMRTHPGDTFARWDIETDEIDESDLYHWFKADRGGQIRGVSEMCQSLNLYAQIRRLSLATLTAAETAASLAAIFQTQSMPMDEDMLPDYDKEIEAFDDFALEHGMIMAAPRGYEAMQMKAEQPTTTFSEFQGSIVDEAGIGQQAPSNKARGNAKDYNYSSVRADNQPYMQMLRTERTDLGDDGLDRFASWYFREARLVYPEFRDIDPDDLPDHVWYFDGQPHVDEQKHATAVTTLVNAELMAEDDYLLENGIDPETHHEKIRIQRQRKADLAKVGPAPGQTGPATPPEDDDDEDSDDE